MEQGNGKMMEMISLLGTLTSVRSSEPRIFAAKQNMLVKKLLNLYWDLYGRGNQERNIVRKAVSFCKVLIQFNFQQKQFGPCF